MIVALTTGKWPILRCPACHTVFTGPLARSYLLAHYPLAGTCGEFSTKRRTQ